jgi:DNA polymerase-3 subunit epsilon
VTDELALFGDEPRVASAQPVAVPTRIADWQRNLIRKALDARGLTAMEERQLTVEGAVGRAVPNLRDLTHDEAIGVLNRLGETESRVERSTSLWESREEPTWIDRL